MTNSNEMTTRSNEGVKALLIHRRRGDEETPICLQGSDKIVIHRDNQNYTITYGELLDHLLMIFSDAGGDARIIFEDESNDEVLDIYRPSNKLPTEVKINNSVIEFFDKGGNWLGSFTLNQRNDKKITLDIGIDPDEGNWMPYDLNLLARY